MFEVAESGHDHGHAVFVAILYGVVVTDGTAGLYDGIYSRVMGYFHAIRKREERIRCHYGSIEVEIECVSLLNGLTECIYA